MKRRLLDLLCCPICKGWLQLMVLHETKRPTPIVPSSAACRERCELHDIQLGKGLAEPNADECAGCYSREVDEGFLACKACGLLYPIIEAVPRLVRNAELEYRTFFDRHCDVIQTLTGREP
ncbi:MAG TPA: Trm112 family protein, partial [Nitrospira sp.]|nr:Trm112 family protein [Nitrospira sp.]